MSGAGGDDEHTEAAGPPAPPPEEAWLRLGAEPGLCRSCCHARLKISARSVFLRCALADQDPRFPRYPRLPVPACDGHAPAGRA